MEWYRQEEDGLKCEDMERAICSTVEMYGERLDYPTFTGTAGKDFIKPLNQKLRRVLWRINVIDKESTAEGVTKQ